MLLIVLACLVTLAAGQVNYDCAACDGYAARMDRTGCRMFCMIDIVTVDDLWDVPEMDECYTNTWGCAALGGCDLVAFGDAVRDVIMVCDLEIERAFDLLKIQDPASDPNLIDQSDLQAWRTTIIADYNPGGDCTEAAVQAWWNFRYPLLEDPACTIGL